MDVLNQFLFFFSLCFWGDWVLLFPRTHFQKKQRRYIFPNSTHPSFQAKFNNPSRNIDFTLSYGLGCRLLVTVTLSTNVEFCT